MKKLFFAATIFLILILCSNAFALTSSEKKLTSSFISAFTEAGLFNFDLENADPDDDNLSEYEEPALHLGHPANLPELIRFGIVHNLINNKKNLKQCRDPECESGSLTIDKKIVFDTVKKYFNIDISNKDLSNIIEENPSVVFSFDGKLFHFDDSSFSEPGNDTVYFADVQGVTKRGENLMFAGDIYDSKNITSRPGMFAAVVKPVKNSWVIISMTTDWVTNAGRD
ncbi:MAG: hypothetical protein IJ859_12010 [Synergistaceae bacterium]|nr:hypothetical protein [Synergistaceae bacterium]